MFRHALISERKQKMNIKDYQSCVLVNHVPPSLEDRVYLYKPIEWKIQLCDQFDVFAGLV